MRLYRLLGQPLEIAAQGAEVVLRLEGKVEADQAGLDVGIDQHRDQGILEAAGGDHVIDEAVLGPAQVVEGLAHHLLFLGRAVVDDQQLEVGLSRAVGGRVAATQLVQGVQGFQILCIGVGLAEVDVATPVGLADQRPHQALDHLFEQLVLLAVEQRPDVPEILLGGEGVVVLDDLQASQLVFTCDDIGENLVTLSYTGSQTGSCTISVNVIDKTGPELILKDIGIDLNLEGSASLDFSDIDNGSVDNCGVFTYTLSQDSFTCDDIGRNTVNVTATDEFGNTVTGTAIVTVYAESDICYERPGSPYVFIYPNPSQGLFKIASPSNELVERVEVYDNRGRFIKAKDFAESDLEYVMELEPLQEAIYVVKIITSKHEYPRKLIIRH